jgi:UDP-glucose 4-epimerase
VKIIVTGGGGFIGRATMEAAVSAGHQATSFDRAHGQDILTSDLSGWENAAAVIHLAGVLGTSELFDTPELAVDVNVGGTLRVLKACEQYGLGYVGITMPPVFDSVYTATKICADRLATAWHKSKGVPVSHVCAFNAYGPGQAHGPGHPQKIVPTFATHAWNGLPIPIWGDGEQTVDLVHSDDLGRLLVAATGYGDDEVFDGGTGQAWTVNEVAHQVLAITGSSAGIQYLPMRDGENPTQIVAEGRGWEKLGWKPTHDGAKFTRCVNWYNEAMF